MRFLWKNPLQQQSRKGINKFDKKQSVPKIKMSNTLYILFFI
jgi:hypothetical protein